MKISDIRTGMRNLSIEATIKDMSEPRTVNLKAGGTTTVCDVILADNTSEIKLSLWGEDVGRFAVGDRLMVENGYVNMFRGENQLAVGRFGRIRKLGE